MTEQDCAEADAYVRESLRERAKELDGACWCGVPLAELNPQELIGAIASMKHSDEANTRYYQDRLKFLLGRRE